NGLATRADLPDGAWHRRRAHDARDGAAFRRVSWLYGLRDGLPVRCPVRPAHRGDQGTGRAAPSPSRAGSPAPPGNLQCFSLSQAAARTARAVARLPGHRVEPPGAPKPPDAPVPRTGGAGIARSADHAVRAGAAAATGAGPETGHCGAATGLRT